jgi:excisionase family DNA binding protein
LDIVVLAYPAQARQFQTPSQITDLASRLTPSLFEANKALTGPFLDGVRRISRTRLKVSPPSPNAAEIKPERRSQEAAVMGQTGTQQTRPERHLAPRLVRIKEAAVYLGMSTWKLRDLVQQGRLPVIRGEGTYAPWLFDVRDLDDFVNKEKEHFSTSW